MDPSRATQLTSCEAYWGVVESTRAQRERAVLLGLERCHQGTGRWPTAYELFEYMRETGIGGVKDLNSVRPRLTALKGQHLVFNEADKRPCRVTGISALTWRLPDGKLF